MISVAGRQSSAGYTADSHELENPAAFQLAIARASTIPKAVFGDDIGISASSWSSPLLRPTRSLKGLA
jgi:hypothetical protein